MYMSYTGRLFHLNDRPGHLCVFLSMGHLRIGPLKTQWRMYLTYATHSAEDNSSKSHYSVDAEPVIQDRFCNTVPCPLSSPREGLRNTSFYRGVQNSTSLLMSLRRAQHSVARKHQLQGRNTNPTRGTTLAPELVELNSWIFQTMK